MELADERFVSLTTFTKDGRPKSTPVWIAALGDGSVGFTTQSSSWKVRRIRHTPKVLVQPSDMRGRVKAGTDPVEGTAEVVTGSGFESVRDEVAGKYGLQYRLVGLRDRIAGMLGRDVPESCGIVIRLDD